MAMEPGLVAYFVCSVALELFLLAWCCQAAWKYRGMCRELRHRLATAVKKCFCCGPVIKDKRVLEGIREYQRMVADRLLTYLLCVCVVAVLSVQLNLLAGSTRWLTEGQMWLVIALMLVMVVAKRNSSTLQGWGLDTIGLIFGVFSIAYVSPPFQETNYFVKSTLIATAFIRIPAVACLTRIPLVMLSNMGSLAHATYRVATEDFLDPCDPFSDGGFAIRIEIMCSMSVLGFAVFMNSIIQQKADLEMERGAVARQLSAASSLLRLTCDAVIELDKDMRLTHDSPELSTMLLKTGSTSLEGSSFLELLLPEDALRAAEYLTSESERVHRQFSFSSDRSDRQISARAFHTRLVDSYNAKICTEVFQVRYTKLDGEKCNLLGLRDFTDVRPLAGDADDAVEAQTSQMQNSMSMSLPMFMSPTTSEIGEPASPSPSLPPRGKTLYLDIDMDGLLVHAASSSLVHLAGKTLREVFPSPHTSLLLQSLQLEVLQNGWQDASRILTYKELPFSGVRGGITGTMQVTKTRYDKVHVLMAFTTRGARTPDRRSKLLRQASLTSL